MSLYVLQQSTLFTVHYTCTELFTLTLNDFFFFLFQVRILQKLIFKRRYHVVILVCIMIIYLITHSERRYVCHLNDCSSRYRHFLSISYQKQLNKFFLPSSPVRGNSSSIEISCTAFMPTSSVS